MFEKIYLLRIYHSEKYHTSYCFDESSVQKTNFLKLNISSFKCTRSQSRIYNFVFVKIFDIFKVPHWNKIICMDQS